MRVPYFQDYVLLIFSGAIASNYLARIVYMNLDVKQRPIYTNNKRLSCINRCQDKLQSTPPLILVI